MHAAQASAAPRQACTRRASTISPPAAGTSRGLDAVCCTVLTLPARARKLHLPDQRGGRRSGDAACGDGQSPQARSGCPDSASPYPTMLFQTPSREPITRPGCDTSSSTRPSSDPATGTAARWGSWMWFMTGVVVSGRGRAEALRTVAAFAGMYQGLSGVG